VDLYCTPYSAGCLSWYGNSFMGSSLTNSSGYYSFPTESFLPGFYTAYTEAMNSSLIVIARSNNVSITEPGLSFYVNGVRTLTIGTNTQLTFSGRLLDLSGNPVVGASVTFKYSGLSITNRLITNNQTTTGAGGNYSVRITGFGTTAGFPEGSYTVTAYVNRVSGVAPARDSDDVSLTVTAPGDSLTLGVTPSSGTSATLFAFSGVLRDAGGYGMSERPIQINCLATSCSSFPDGVIASTLTGFNGAYLVQYNGFAAGNFTVYATYTAINATTGSDSVFALSHASSFRVSPSGANGGNYSLTALTITSSSTCVSIGDSFTLTAFLKNITTLQALPGRTITFEYALNSSAYETLGTAVTASDGYASISFTAAYNGSYIFVASVVLGAQAYNSAGVLVQTGIGCATIPPSCGFLGLGCVLGSVVGTFTSIQSAFAGLWGGFGGIANFFSNFLNPIYWLNKLGFGWIINAFGYMVDAFLIFINIVIATLPYLGFIILIINLFYVVQFDFEGLFGFWMMAYQIVAVIASAIFSFVQIIIDAIQALEGGAGGVGGAVAAGA
jgi:hypothetical protein